MLEVYPLADTIKTLLMGTGDCAKVVWTFLGLSIPEWSIQVFTLIVILGIYQVVKSKTATFRNA
jgi:disulfide bond formation protein DsbB